LVEAQRRVLASAPGAMRAYVPGLELELVLELELELELELLATGCWQ
jgi:hypothetical protein